MATKLGGPITMRRFSVSPNVAGALQRNQFPDVMSGRDVVKYVTWLEEHGDTVISVSELWMEIALDIWVAMSPKN